MNAIMKSIPSFFVVLSVLGYFPSAEKLPSINDFSTIRKTEKEYGSHFDMLIEELSSQNWADDERSCIDHILDTIVHVKNATLWATWVWDSMQFPVGQLYGSRYHLGNYDQCLREKDAPRPPFSMQYCLADILLQPNSKVSFPTQAIDAYGPADAYIGSMTRLEQRFNEMSWGVCLPRECKTKSVEKFIKILLKQSHLGHLQSLHNITIGCEIPKKSDANINAHNFVITFVLLTTLIVVACTIYVSKKQTVDPPSVENSIVRCFCLKRNAKELMQRNNNDVNSLHGIRFLSSAIIVLAHVFFVMTTITVGNGLDFEEHFNTYGIIILNLVIVVDTFFFISGLLFMRNIKSNTTARSLLNNLIKRYFRLIWWYIACVLILVLFTPKSECGPICAKFGNYEQEACYKGWWYGMLMVGNYHNVFQMCMPIAWYIFSDFQLSVVSSVVVWIYQRQKRVGIACYTILATLSVVVPACLSFDVPELTSLPLKFDMYSIMKDESNPMMSLYAKTHNRASSYFMGILMGYVMGNYRARDIKSFFTKKRLLKGLLTMATISIILMILYGIGNDSLMTSLLVALFRPSWALSMSVVIGLCEYGHFPIVNDFLSWRAFVPLSKLTYGIYMVHCITIVMNTFCTRSPLYYTTGILIEKFLGNFTMSAFISLYFLLFVESPLNNIVKMMLASRGNIKQKMVNGVTQNESNRIKTNSATQERITEHLDHKFKQL